MGPGIRLIALLSFLDVVLSVVTEEEGLLLEEETTAASSFTKNTEGKGQIIFRTTGSINNRTRLPDQLTGEQFTTYKPLTNDQAGLTTGDRLSVSSKMDKEGLSPIVTLNNTVETETPMLHSTPQLSLHENSTSATHSSPPVPGNDSGITHALQDASVASTADSSSTATSNTTPAATSGGLLSRDNAGVTATTMKSKTPASKGPEAVFPGPEVPNVTTGRPQTTVSDAAMDVYSTSSTKTPAAMPPSSDYSTSSNTHWYIIAAVIVLALLILIICFAWNVRRRRNTGSTSFQNAPKKRNRKAGEDAWAGPVQMPEENCTAVDVAEDGKEPSSKRLTLTTLFTKRKSRPCSVVLEEVAAQPVKSPKDEVSPLLTSNANGQANGSPSTSQCTQNISPTSKESCPTSVEHVPPSPPEDDIQTIGVQGPPPAQTADDEVLPPPPSPPPGTDFPAPPPSPENAD